MKPQPHPLGRIDRGPDEFDEQLVLDATDELEFVAMMRRMVEWSGRTRGQIALYGGLPRSSVYHFVAPKTRTMPRKPDQVRAFAQACQLNPIEIRRVMWLWERIRETQPRDARSYAIPTSMMDEAIDEEVVSELVEDRAADCFDALTPQVRAHLLRVISERHLSGVGADVLERNRLAGDQADEPTASTTRDVVFDGNLTVNNRLEDAKDDGEQEDGDLPNTGHRVGDRSHSPRMAALRDDVRFHRMLISISIILAAVVLTLAVVVAAVTLASTLELMEALILGIVFVVSTSMVCSIWRLSRRLRGTDDWWS
ncbi:hypothetical protein [Lentzea sp. NEAU-D7]|uniref:hypothetical protein n=1 Tax=Lentzea sp. NEAU-D7 TaxID=2994667 RepID=UPI00224BA112|nr:hypothetical protein [Lentzea sp. NEAU-D7]MCX2952375.1 hypothetical protein [Lentzea sp. NEAU-D7]